ncbi:MAG: LytR/AlgR family response regulator transcription factor [Saprospiraceae bacterium]
MNYDYPQIALQGIEGLMFVRPDEILYAIADGNYTHVHLTQNRQTKVLRQLKEVEDLLPSEKFIRIHRSHVINLDHVIRLGDNETILMTDGQELTLARDRKMDFIEKFTRI